MTQRKSLSGWPMLTMLTLMVIILVFALLTLPSMLLPYMASPHYKRFCYFVLAPVSYIIFFGISLCIVYRARNTPKVKRLSLSRVLLVRVFGSAFFIIPWACMCMLIVPAIPSKFFARKVVDFPVTVDHLEGFRLDTDYWTWIYFDQGGDINRFMWTRADLLLSKLKHGDCIMLHAREWPLGIYVDSISRSNACQSSSEAESRTTSTHA
jgi:hypothetical protein